MNFLLDGGFIGTINPGLIAFNHDLHDKDITKFFKLTPIGYNMIKLRGEPH